MQREVSVGTSLPGSCLLGPSCERPGSQEGGKPEGHHPFPRLLLRSVDGTAQNFPARGGAGARLRMTASRPGVLTGTSRPSREPHRSRQDLRPVLSAKGISGKSEGGSEMKVTDYASLTEQIIQVATLSKLPTRKYLRKESFCFTNGGGVSDAVTQVTFSSALNIPFYRQE